MADDRSNYSTGGLSKEKLFEKRLAEMRAKNNEMPWNSSTEAAQFEIPREQSKLFADKYIEDPTLSDEEIERRALLDLTSYNFWTFYKRLNYELRRAKRYERQVSLLLVAVDNLETVTKRWGLQAENAVILGVGKLVLSCVRDVDIAGRCRDDTFGVILPETGRSGAEVAAERMRTKMERYSVDFQGDLITISVSVGGSSYPGSAKEVDHLVAEAVDCLKQSFTQGGNCVTFPSA